MTTENTSHTPGASRAATEIWYIVNQRPIPGYILDSWATLIDRETAAPALLEALHEARTLIEFFHCREGWDEYQQSPEMKRIDAAIAKAEGGAA